VRTSIRTLILALAAAFVTVPAAGQSNDNNVEWAGLEHNTFSGFYRTPFGAVTTGTQVNLRFRTFRNDVTGVFLRVYEYNPPTNTTTGPFDTPFAITSSDATFDYWSLNYHAPATPKVIYYKFRVVDGTDTDFYSDLYLDDHDNVAQGGPGATSDNEPFPAFQLTVYDPNFSTPEWLHNSAVYHIFPDRFRNGDVTNDWCRAGSSTGCPSLYGAPPSSNIAYSTWNSQICDPRQPAPCPNNYGSQFFGGDLNGIEQKLDYIKGLGFDAIYLNPIFKARSNHRYDTDDFLSIAPELGGDAAFQSLVAAANQRGIRLILDGVWNHMSQDSEFFDYYRRSAVVGACESLGSPYRSWFNFFNNNAPCSFTDYEGWFGFGGLPVLNETPPVKDFFYRTPTTNVTQYWYDRGAGGWRFDVATDISHQWWNEYRGYAKTYKPDGALIGEIFPDASQYLAGDQLDGVMNYRFRKNVIGFARSVDWADNDNNGNNRIVGLTPSQFDAAMRSIREDYPEPAQRAMLNLLGSHDTNRVLYTLTVPGDTGLVQAKQRLRLAALMQFAHIGAPMVYYGDEAGINAPSLANSPGGFPEDDPYNRAPYPWSDEAGNPNIYGPADSDLIDYFATLGSIRKRSAALRTGDFRTLLTGDTSAQTGDDGTFAFARSAGRDRVVVALNNGSAANTALIPTGGLFADGTILTDRLGSGSYAVAAGGISITLPARGGAILTSAGRAPFDFDGDGRTDLSIYRPSNGQWWLNRSTDGLIVHTFGNSADNVTPGDFTGDGKTDVAFWRPSTGEWFVLRSEDFTFYSFPFGAAGDRPVAADYDGDGKTDAAVFRPSSSTWYVQRSTGGTMIEGFGAAGDFPVPADYDGDLKADIAIFRPSLGQWWLNRSTAGLIAHTFGNSDDRNVQGDYTGDGKADIAFWRPSTGAWFILRSEDSSFYSFPFGSTGDLPAPGDYDGDGKTDAAVFRPSAATWYVQRSTAGLLIQGFGAPTDLPLPNTTVRQ
jgi:glycosidase